MDPSDDSMISLPHTITSAAMQNAPACHYDREQANHFDLLVVVQQVIDARYKSSVNVTYVVARLQSAVCKEGPLF
jgi:hypothetical protein